MKYLLVFVSLFVFHISHSQSSVGFSFGGNFSQIRFQNSEGVLDKDLKGLPGVTASAFYFFDLASGQTNRRTSSNQIGVELGYKSSKFKDKANTILTTWDMQYLTGHITFRHLTSSKNRVIPFFGGGLAMDYLSGGIQSQGFSQFDITEDLNRVNLSVTAETGIKYAISKEAYTTLRLGYWRGLTNLEKDSDQQSFIHAFRLSVAVFFYLGNSKKF